MIVTLLIIAALFILTNYYIAKRLCVGTLKKLPFYGCFFALLLLTTTVFLSVARLNFSAIEAVGAYWMGIFVYLIMFFALSEIAWFIAKLFKIKPKKYWHIARIAVLCLTVIISGYGIYNARQIDNVAYEISIDKTDVSDLNIVMISDVHLGAVGSEERLPEIVNRINELDPDIVCIAGDFFDTDYGSIDDPEKALEEMKKISATYGVYMCMGNHDAGKTVLQMIDFTKRAGITLLNDEYTVIDDRLILVGRLDGGPIGGYGDMERKDLKTFLKDYDTDLPVIVMDHNPINVSTYTNQVDLVLSGHTHKGQIFPANIITGLMYDVDHGYYRKDENYPHVIVTSGVGYWGLPMRVGTDSEIVSIKIK